MPAISYTQITQHFKAFPQGKAEPVCLLFGEELLTQKALEQILAHLLPGKARSHQYEPFDGGGGNLRAALDQVNTFALLGGGRVVALIDSSLFYVRQDNDALLVKVRKAHAEDNIRKAASALLDLMSRQEMRFEDLNPENRAKVLGLKGADATDTAWIDDILSFCREKDLAVPERTDDISRVLNAVEKGFPNGNHLIITTDKVDRRHRLFKRLKESGLVIDCSVPTGNRKADQDARNVVLREQVQAVLSGHGKKLEPAAYQALVALTGFDLRTLIHNVEKLISFVGNRPAITPKDVSAVLERTRKDPIYEFTTALSERNHSQCLFLADTLLKGGDIGHPLQLLAAIINQVRKLVVAKEFLTSQPGRIWHDRCSYSAFQQQVLPAIQAYDRSLLEMIQSHASQVTETPPPRSSPKRTTRSKKKKPSKAPSTRVSSDLLVAANPKNPYPVYLTLKRAAAFDRDHLLDCLQYLQQIDVRMKRGAGNARGVLEEAIIYVCGQPKPPTLL